MISMDIPPTDALLYVQMLVYAMKSVMLLLCIIRLTSRRFVCPVMR